MVNSLLYYYIPVNSILFINILNNIKLCIIIIPVNFFIVNNKNINTAKVS